MRAAALLLLCLTSCADEGFRPADHTALPIIPRREGPVITRPELVTITFPGYAHRARVEAFADFVGASSWLATVGADYGVTGASSRAKVQWPSAAPVSLTDLELRDLLVDGIASGLLPAPASSDHRLLYLVYVPETTIVDASGPGVGVVCFRTRLHTADDPFVQGYNEALRTKDGISAPYAVIGDCGVGADGVTATASRELISATSNPYELEAPGYELAPPPTDPWSLSIESGEVGYMCARESPIMEGGFALRRAWSNTEAAAGRHPCVPVPDDDLPYFNVSAEPARVVEASPGQVLSFTLTGWSTAPVGGWSLALAPTDTASLSVEALRPMLSADRIDNGQRVTLTLTVPSDARTSQIGGVHIRSGALGRIWPVGFTVR